MWADITAVFWKEWKEILTWGGTRSKLNLIITAAIFGVFLPLQTGRIWVEEPLFLIMWVWLPVLLVTTTIADAIAGERERHTLETLLASRLADSAILLGKMAAGATYGLAITWLNMVLGIITVNIAFGAGKVIFYKPAILVVTLAFSLLAAALAAGAGVLVSLRASTVRQAQQTLSLVVMLLLFVPIFGLQALPAATQAQVIQMLEGLKLLPTALSAGGVLLVIDIALILAALARFKRSQLILD